MKDNFTKVKHSIHKKQTQPSKKAGDEDAIFLFFYFFCFKLASEMREL